MRKNLLAIFALGAMLLSTSCASIVSRSKYPISIGSSPTGAKVKIVDVKGAEVYSGTTPTTLVLKANAGFFKKAQYQITFEMMGYETKTVSLQSTLDGWYIGNLVFGGLIGFLIIDPATGAMFKFTTEFVNAKLLELNPNSTSKEKLKIYYLDDIPNEWKKYLVAIDK